MFLYRPHINYDQKVVTTDFIVEEALINLNETGFTPLPVSLLTANVQQGFHNGKTLAGAGVLWFRGAEDDYAAPFSYFLDQDIYENNPAAAMRNVRICVSRHAIVSSDHNDWRLLLDRDNDNLINTKTYSQSPAPQLHQKGRVLAIASGETAPLKNTTELTVTLNAGKAIRHHCMMRALEG